MFKNISLLLIRIIDKVLFLKKRVALTDASSSKNVLVSYVLVPPMNISFYFKSSHNNKYQCYLLINYLKSEGYNVYLHDYLNEDIDYSIPYELFIGHNKTFSRIGKKLKGNPKRILLATGSHPKFGNEQQILRILDVNKRKSGGLQVYDGNIVPDFTENYEFADIILMLGNEFVKHTYEQKIHHKIKLINNVTLHPFFKSNTSRRTNNFLFISSLGQVHRGLDLLLDVFVGLKNRLYVLSSFHTEPEFVKLYNKELYNTENIFPKGYLDLNSNDFKSILDDVDFVILPSCSEGQSSSIVNMMMYGLIPVVPENVGILETERIGIKIETVDLNGVKSSIEQAIGLTDVEFEIKRRALDIHVASYSKDAFVKRLDEIIAG